MKYLAIVVLLFTSSLSIGQISGRVLDPNSEPVIFANVLLKDIADSTFIMGTQTDYLGQFLISADEGSYFIEITYLSFETYLSPLLTLNIKDEKHSLKDITLRENAHDLEEVEISAKRLAVVQTAEGTTLNVQGSIMTRGSNALQVLERSPGVFVDHRNGGLSLNGQSGVTVLIDGRNTRMSNAELLNFLTSLNGEQIDHIDLLTNPSSKYGADGNAGIINISLTKTKKKHLHGSLGLNGGYGSGPKYGINANLSFIVGKVNSHSAYSHSYDESFSQWTAKGTQNMEIQGGPLAFDVISQTNGRSSNHNFNIALDTKLTKKHTIGSTLNFINSTGTPSVFNNTAYQFTDQFFRAHVNSLSNSKRSNMISNVFSDYQLTTKTTINTDISYISFQNRNPSTVENRYFDEDGFSISFGDPLFADGVRGENASQIDLGVAKVDLSSSINPSTKLEAGLKVSTSLTENFAKTYREATQEWAEDLRFATENKLKENIYAGYLSLAYDFDSLTNLTLGGRYEYWTRDFENAGVEDQKFGKLFPTIFLTRKLKNRQQIILTYTQRITRPDFNDLATYSHYNGPVSVFSGNPLLQSTISKKMGLTYQYRTFNLGLNYEDIGNQIIHFQLVTNETEDLFILSPQNATSDQRLNLDLSYNGALFPWWDFGSGGTLSRRKYKIEYTVQAAEKEFTTFTLWTNQTFTLPKKWSLELSGWYNGPFYEGSKSIEGFGMLNAGIKKELGKGSLQLSFTDILSSMSVISRFGTVTDEIFDAKSIVDWDAESALYKVFRLSYHRPFGGSTDTRKRKVTDEERRIAN